MSLAELLSSQKPKLRCATCRWLVQQDPKDVQRFKDYIDRQEGALSLLRESCEEMGLETSPRSFNDHVNMHHRKGIFR